MILWRKSIGNAPQLQRILSPAQYQQLQVIREQDIKKLEDAQRDNKASE